MKNRYILNTYERVEKMNKQNIICELNVEEGSVEYTSSIENALKYAQSEVMTLNETIKSIEKLTPQCDKLDYALAAASGTLCGFVIDVIFVGKPGKSFLGHVNDKWVEKLITLFAERICKKEEKTVSSAIRDLEDIFDVPYDQRGMGDSGSSVFGLNASNHHFKSLGHNPSLLGMFFSILDQFENNSHFVSNSELISLQDADDKFQLRGKTLIGKIFSAFVNWFGHLVSDMSGSSGSKGRGMGIPSPLWTWVNDIVVVKRRLKIQASEFDRAVNELALEIYKFGYDMRFQSTQAIPVVINELIVRFLYSFRRMLKYLSKTKDGKSSFELVWKECEPFKNPTVKRMLTVAHGTFCAIDAGEAIIRGFIAGGGIFDPVEFILRLNIPGVGRFAVSLYDEAKRGINRCKAEREILFAKREKIIAEDYIKGLKILAKKYKDRDLVNFADDLKKGMYIEAFEKSVELAEKRGVSKNERVNNKAEIDGYFKKGRWK